MTESSGQVNSGEDGAAGPGDIHDTLTNILHGVFIHVGVGVSIESGEVLYGQHAPILLGHHKDGTVEFALGWLEDPQI